MERRKKIFTMGQLTDKAGAEEVKDFISEHKFFVLELDEKTLKNEILKKMAEKAGFYCTKLQMHCYKHMAIVINGTGQESFNKVFHRSISDVDSKMIPHKKFKEIFVDEGVCDFFRQMKKDIGDIQIRGMKEARIRVPQTLEKTSN